MKTCPCLSLLQSQTALQIHGLWMWDCGNWIKYSCCTFGLVKITSTAVLLSDDASKRSYDMTKLVLVHSRSELLDNARTKFMTMKNWLTLSEHAQDKHQTCTRFAQNIHLQYSPSPHSTWVASDCPSGGKEKGDFPAVHSFHTVGWQWRNSNCYRWHGLGR